LGFATSEMINLKSAFQILAAYLSLSPTGKRFLKKAAKNSRLANQKLGHPVSPGLNKILHFIRMFKICDKVFNAQVTGKLCLDLGRKRNAMYSRFVAYGWFSLLIWSRLLEAFNLGVDEGAKERCVLIAFTHREWNDLFDNQGYTYEQLVQAFDYQSQIPQGLSFLRQLKHLEKKFAPPEHFGTFYQHLQGFRVCSLFEYTPQKAQVILDQVAPYVVMLFIYVMVPQVPQELKETIKPISRWLYMLDEFADLEHDRKKGRITYMTMVNDPEGALREQFEQAQQVILKYALRPDELIKLMEMITRGVIDSRRAGIDLESNFLNLS
jgi:hypothetical protein